MKKINSILEEIKKLLNEGNFKNEIEKGKTVAIIGGRRVINHYSIIIKP